MTFEEYRSDHFMKMQRQINIVCWTAAILTFVLEMIIFAVNLNFGFITNIEKRYLVLRVIIPSTINFSGAFSLSLIRRSKATETKKNYAACFGPLICCTTIACAHCYYTFLLFCVLIPLFTSTIFASKKILRVISFATFYCTILASVWYFIEYSNQAFAHRLMSIFCLFGLYAASVYVCAGLVYSQTMQINFISENYKQQRQLIEELKIEPMTGLYNKNCMETCLKTYTEKFNQGLFNPTCCIIDIDFFKKVNDTYGHLEGDKVLKNLAHIIKQHMGGIRQTFRFGGEEFVILWENDSIEEVYSKVCDIKKDFCASDYDFAPGKVFTFSAGICKLAEDMTSEQWFKNVDDTLYKAKQEGRDRIYLF